MPELEMIADWLRLVLVPGLGGLLAAALFALLRRYIRRLDDERLREFLLELVRAAEQVYGRGSGAEKRRYVIEELERQGLGDVQDHAIEAAVYRLNTE